MNQPLVSIVIPCYNARQYVGEAIESALTQTYPHREVIVIDDGSTDGSVDVLRAFGNQIRWETGPNRGACAARNRGIELSLGKFIQFLDADDLLLPDKLSMQVPLATHSSVCMTCCDWLTSELCAATEPYVTPVPDVTGDPVILALTHFLTISGPLHHRAALLDIGGFREDLTCCQDSDLQLRLACRGLTFRRLPVTLFHRRIREHSVSSNYERVLLQSREVYWCAFDLLSVQGELTDLRARAFSARMASDGRALLRFGNAAAAALNFQDAYRMHSSGGVLDAYRGHTRLVRRFLGARITEKLVSFKRQSMPRLTNQR
ncbi:MAG: glycosyltransferase family 2 protein [Planctomycetaceae bacterium]